MKINVCHFIRLKYLKKKTTHIKKNRCMDARLINPFNYSKIVHHFNFRLFDFRRSHADILGWHSFTRASHSRSDGICRETFFASLCADLKTTPSTKMETLYPTWVLAAISSPSAAHRL